MGLAPVKQQIQELVARASIDSDRRAAGLPVQESTMHLVMAGAPGTGKTTVARELGQMYFHMGLVSKDPSSDEGWTEVSRAQLVRPYQGQTADAVRKLFEGDLEKGTEGAAGGVIFVDEAYDLYHGEQDDYGREAVSELLRQAENHRGDTVVILAGYTDKMERLFATANPGLSRRFPTTLNFPEYSLDERYQIMQRYMTAGKYTIGSKQSKQAESVRAAVKDALTYTGAGNAGDVRNLFDKITTAQAIRLSRSRGAGPHDQKALRSITEADVKAGVSAYVTSSRVESPLRARLVPTKRKKKEPVG